MNIDAAYLHILGDMLNSVGVIIAAVIIKIWQELWYVDPICTYIFAIICIWTTRGNFMQSIKLLLVATPTNIDLDDIKTTLSKLDGIDDVHDLHVWGLTMEKFCLTVHLTVNESHYQR